MLTNKLIQRVEQEFPDIGIKIYSFVSEQRNCLIQRSQFGVCFDPDKWTRRSCHDLEIEIEEVWLNKLKLCKVYNGKKFRFVDFNLYEDEVNINLSITCYKDIVGISQSKTFLKWQTRGTEETGDSQAYMSDGLGVGVLTFSKDGYLILIRRAEWTGEYPGMIDRPGGHPEPDNVLGTNITTDQKTELQDMITNEVWSSPIQELEAEIGISVDQIKEQSLLGLVRNTCHAGRPSLEFTTSVECTSEEVVRKYNLKKHAEAEESTTLHLMSQDQLKLIIDNLMDGGRTESQSFCTRSSPTSDIKNFTPALKGALILWGYANLKKE